MSDMALMPSEGSNLLPSPASFPEGVLPARIEESLSVAASAYTVPFAVPAVTFLAVIGAAVGRTRGLEVKPSWITHPNLYWALVARSGMGKSPCSNAILKPIHERENTSFNEHKIELDTYELELREWQGSFARAQRKNDTPPEKPIYPTWEQIYVEDSTTQAVGSILSNNPRGILWYRDELSGMLADLGRYDNKGGDGGDKARLLSAYDCGPWKVSRSTKDALHIPHACVSIFGTVQPALLPSLFKHKDTVSGFLPRFLFIRCEQEAPPLWTSESFDGEPAKHIHELVYKALDLSFGSDNSPCIIKLSDAAKRDVKDWYDNQVLVHWYQPQLEQFEALAPKLRGAFFKLCLIIHMLDCWSMGKSELCPVHHESVQRTIILMEWLQEQQRQVWTLLSAGNKFQEASAIERRVAKAIVELSTKLNLSLLPTSKIVEFLNRDLPVSFHIIPDAVGKTYKKLGIETGRNSKERGAKLTPEIIGTLSKYFSTEKPVIGVIGVTKPFKSEELQSDKSMTPKVTPIFKASSDVTVKNDHKINNLQQK
ncbi:Protein of unknown function [Maridesulfovibrio ferrireducens]|uniref:DUF3987 domain-containing protein n=1 Tax=Maridesulfovibrio ferrireducens TaxID=246191 RepID=A0A1G9IBK4_9BACT|nr:DUF3987 domain-containing protein [Maridesulfovibrio ferrireducens]SDL22502.1 Protein of unknown function [Maridesulfovibrio ferrireducens]